jgi:hypothetical protein
MRAELYSETFVHIHQTAQHNIAGDDIIKMILNFSSKRSHKMQV